MSGLPEQRRQVLNFLAVNTAKTPFDREILDQDIRTWFSQVNERHAKGASARQLQIQMKRTLLSEKDDLDKQIAALPAQGQAEAADAPPQRAVLEARRQQLTELLDGDLDLASFKSSFPDQMPNEVREFIAYGLREGLYVSIPNSIQCVGNISGEGHVIPFAQKPGGEGIVERYQAEEDPYSFEYELTVPCANTVYAIQNSRGDTETQPVRASPNELTVTYKIKVTLPEKYDFQDASIDQIRYSITQYELTYTDNHQEELLFAPRVEAPQPDELVEYNPVFDSKFYRFSNGGNLPDPRILERATSLKSAREQAPEFLGFFHQAMVYQRPNEKLVFVVQPFQIDQREGSLGASANLKAILDFCQSKKIEADIISPVAEKSYRSIIENSILGKLGPKSWSIRQHFVTYHYTTQFIFSADPKASGFDEKTEVLLSGNCYDSKTQLPFGLSSDAQPGLLKELGFTPAQMTRQYVGVQSNDIDCGYWSTVTTEALLRGHADVLTYLKQPLTNADMLSCKAFALSEAPYNHEILNLAATLQSATTQETTAEPVSSPDGTSTPSASAEPVSDVDVDSSPASPIAATQAVEDDEFEEIKPGVLQITSAMLPRTEKSTCLVVLGLLGHRLLPVSVVSPAHISDWCLEPTELQTPATRIEMTRKRYAAMTARSETVVPPQMDASREADLPQQADLPEQVDAPLVLDAPLLVADPVPVESEETARQATLQALAEQLERQEAERQAAEKQRIEKQQAEAKALQKARLEKFDKLVQKIDPAALAEARARYAINGMLAGIVATRKKDAPESKEDAKARLREMQADLNKLKLPAVPVSPIPEAPPASPDVFMSLPVSPVDSAPPSRTVTPVSPIPGSPASPVVDERSGRPVSPLQPISSPEPVLPPVTTLPTDPSASPIHRQSEAGAPSLGSVTPVQSEQSPPKKPGWFAGWHAGHVFAALGLFVLCLTIILIPAALAIWRHVLQPNIRKNLEKQSPASTAPTRIAGEAETETVVLTPGVPAVLASVPAKDDAVKAQQKKAVDPSLRLTPTPKS